MCAVHLLSLMRFAVVITVKLQRGPGVYRSFGRFDFRKTKLIIISQSNFLQLVSGMSLFLQYLIWKRHNMVIPKTRVVMGNFPGVNVAPRKFKYVLILEPMTKLAPKERDCIRSQCVERYR